MAEMTQVEAGRRPINWLRLLVTVLAVLCAAGAAYWYGVNSVRVPGGEAALKIYGLSRTAATGLAAPMTDANGDLIADPPQDESQWLDPATLTFSYLATEQDHYRDVWAGFLQFLSERIGRPAEYLRLKSVDEQLVALKEGRLHITGINTGGVPTAVNACGFVPVCSFAKGGKRTGYTMQIIAAESSPIRKISDLRGKRLTFTNPSSNSGWKAPLMLLKRDYDLLPIRDFDVVYSNGHAESLQGIADGQYEVAAVASDELALAISRGLLEKDEFRVIYESEPFSHNVLGYGYRLKPNLAEQVRKAFLEFDWHGSRLQEEFAAIGADGLTPISYKNDFKLIREIDAVMGRRNAVAVQASKVQPAEVETPPSQEGSANTLEGHRSGRGLVD